MVLRQTAKTYPTDSSQPEPLVQTGHISGTSIEFSGVMKVGQKIGKSALTRPGHLPHGMLVRRGWMTPISEQEQDN